MHMEKKLIGAKGMLPPNFLPKFSVQYSFHWHLKWNNPVSSSLKLRSERDLSWQSPTGTKSHVDGTDVHLKTQQHIILNLNCSNYCI